MLPQLLYGYCYYNNNNSNYMCSFINKYFIFIKLCIKKRKDRAKYII